MSQPYDPESSQYRVVISVINPKGAVHKRTYLFKPEQLHMTDQLVLKAYHQLIQQAEDA